jgi:MinD superfamily P-loop ATPase
MGWQWKLIQEECTGCGICADVCPHDAICMAAAMAYPEPAPLACTGCMICIAECPFAAIDVEELATAAGQ